MTPSDFDTRMLADAKKVPERGWLIVAALIAFAIILALVATNERAAGKADAEKAHFRIVLDTVVDSIHVVEERRVVDTVRIRVAEQHTKAAIVAFDSAAARVEAVADTSPVIPTSLVMPEIQACRDMRDTLLAQLDIRKVYERDDAEEIALQKRRGDLFEAQLKKVTPRRFDRFKVGVIITVLAEAAAYVALRR